MRLHKCIASIPAINGVTSHWPLHALLPAADARRPQLLPDPWQAQGSPIGHIDAKSFYQRKLEFSRRVNRRTLV